MIFTRKLDAGGGGVAPGRRQRRPAGGAVSVIGPELVVTGNLESTGELQIHGDVEGDVYAARILVSEQARVAGELVADEIIIAGIVQGSVRGNSVTFRTDSRIEGEVYHRTLAIEQGAYFEGKSRRTENPTGHYGGNGGSGR